jgi:hypothetical protein
MTEGGSEIGANLFGELQSRFVGVPLEALDSAVGSLYPRLAVVHTYFTPPDEGNLRKISYRNVPESVIREALVQVAKELEVPPCMLTKKHFVADMRYDCLNKRSLRGLYDYLLRKSPDAVISEILEAYSIPPPTYDDVVDVLRIQKKLPLKIRYIPWSVQRALYETIVAEARRKEISPLALLNGGQVDAFSGGKINLYAYWRGKKRSVKENGTVLEYMELEYKERELDTDIDPVAEETRAREEATARARVSSEVLKSQSARLASLRHATPQLFIDQVVQALLRVKPEDLTPALISRVADRMFNSSRTTRPILPPSREKPAK